MKKYLKMYFEDNHHTREGLVDMYQRDRPIIHPRRQRLWIGSITCPDYESTSVQIYVGSAQPSLAIPDVLYP